MHRKSAHQIRNAVQEGEISAVETTTKFLHRINKYDKDIRSFLTVLEEKALKKAEEVDEKRKSGKALGKLAGVPVAIKDNIHIHGENTTCGSRFLENYKAPFSASVIRFIEQEDGIVIGKTNLDEFAMGSSNENSAFFSSKNPWNLKTSPGGSSGGSAAAVSARFAPLSLGTDTGGSIRQPAAFTGTVGFKPTYGRVSRYGLVAFGSSLDQIGPFANTVEDAALMMEVIGRHCKNDLTSLEWQAEPYMDHLTESIQGKTLGVPRSFLSDLQGETKEHFEESIEIFKKLGATIQDIDLPNLKHSISVYYILATAEASTNLARFDGVRYGKRSLEAQNLEEVYDLSRTEGFGPEVKQRILLGTYVLSSGFQDAYYRKAQQVRSLIKQDFGKAFKQCHALLMPTTSGPAFELGSIRDPLQMYLQDLYTISANLAGIPALTLPSGLTKNRLPMGIQILGDINQDATVLRFAHHYEKERGALPTPPLFNEEES